MATIEQLDKEGRQRAWVLSNRSSFTPRFSGVLETRSLNDLGQRVHIDWLSVNGSNVARELAALHVGARQHVEGDSGIRSTDLGDDPPAVVDRRQEQVDHHGAVLPDFPELNGVAFPFSHINVKAVFFERPGNRVARMA